MDAHLDGKSFQGLRKNMLKSDSDFSATKHEWFCEVIVGWQNFDRNTDTQKSASSTGPVQHLH